MKLNERHLMQLAAVLDAGGVSEGAALLGLTQPAVSRSLAQLEARVGQPLFQKGRRPLQATPIGHQLATHGRAILAASRKAGDAVEGFLSGTRGLVRLGGVPFFMDAIITRMVAAFQNGEPAVTVQQSYGYFPEMAAALHADQIDLAIVPMAQAVPPPGLAFTELLEGRNVVACRAGHPLTRKRPLRASDLGDYPWVAPLPGSALASDLQAILLAIGLSELTVRYAGGNLMSVVTYMSETDALAVLPYSVVFAGRREGRVTALPLTIPQPGRAVGILRRDGPARGTAADRLASFVAAEFGELRHLIKRHESAVVWAR